MTIGELKYKLDAYPDEYEVRILFPSGSFDTLDLTKDEGEIKEIRYDNQIDTFVTIEVE